MMTLSLDEITGAGEAVPKQEYERREGEGRGKRKRGGVMKGEEEVFEGRGAVGSWLAVKTGRAAGGDY